MPKEKEGKQPFYCPFPGCKRKFASLWRLKVHYRAPPNERGSGKERGHGVELPICPACGEELQPKTHHNRCKAGRTSNPSKRSPRNAPTNNRSTKLSRSTTSGNRRQARKAMSDSNDMEAAELNPAIPAAFSEAMACARSEHMHTCEDDEELDDVDLPQGSFMIPPLFSCTQQTSHAQGELVQGFPTFDLHFLSTPHTAEDAMRDSDPSSTHEIPQNPTDDAHTDAFSLPHTSAPNLSAQGAAQVLYTIARGDTDCLPAASDSAQNRQFDLSPLSADSDAAAAGIEAECPHADLLTATSAPLPKPCTDSSAPLSRPCTAEGVPINGMPGGLPIMIPWGAGNMPCGMQMTGSGMHMVMSPAGLVPISQGAPMYLPLQLQELEEGAGGGLAVAAAAADAAQCMQAGYGLIVPQEAMQQQMVFAAECPDAVRCVDAEGQPVGLPVLQMRGGALHMPSGGLPGGLGLGLGGMEPHAPGIPQEQFLAAIRNASATEISATS